MAETVEMYQYVCFKETVEAQIPDTGIAGLSLPAAQFPVIVLSGQKIIVKVTDSGEHGSVSFSGVRLDAATGAELGKVNIGSYPVIGENVLLYQCPPGSNEVGLVTIATSDIAVVNVAVSVSPPASPEVIESGDLHDYEIISYKSFLGWGRFVTRSIVMTAGQKIVPIVPTAGKANVGFVVMGREFASDGAETLINQGIVNTNEYNDGLVLYTCPTGKTAIVDLITCYDGGISPGTPSTVVYLSGIAVTSDENGNYTGGGGEGQ